MDAQQIEELDDGWTELPDEQDVEMDGFPEEPVGFEIADLQQKYLARYMAPFQDDWRFNRRNSMPTVISTSVTLNARLGLPCPAPFIEPPTVQEMLFPTTPPADEMAKPTEEASDEEAMDISEDEATNLSKPEGEVGIDHPSLALFRRLEFFERTQPSFKLPLLSLAFYRIQFLPDDNLVPQPCMELIIEFNYTNAVALTLSEVDLTNVRHRAHGDGAVEPDWQMGKRWMWFTIKPNEDPGLWMTIALPTETVRKESDMIMNGMEPYGGSQDPHQVQDGAY